MDVSEILGSPRVRAKTAEARRIAVPLLSPAIRAFEIVKRELGREIALDFGGELIKPEAREMYKYGRQTATRLLFEGCAELAFQARTGAEDFIGALDEIQEKVRAELEASIRINGITEMFSAFDFDEAQLCRLEWERKAWEAKPSIMHRVRRRLQRNKPAISSNPDAPSPPQGTYSARKGDAKATPEAVSQPPSIESPTIPTVQPVEAEHKQAGGQFSSAVADPIGDGAVLAATADDRSPGMAKSGQNCGVPPENGPQAVKEPGSSDKPEVNKEPCERSNAEAKAIPATSPEDRLAQFMRDHPGATYADMKYSANVHTPEFQDWRRGNLNPDSVMTKRIEDVLRGAISLKKKPPKSRNE